MASWQGKSKGSQFGYSIFVFILRKLGLLPAYVVLRFVALYYFLFSYQSSKHQWFYFRRMRGYSQMKSLGKLYRNYYLFGQTIIDKVVVMSGIKSPFTFNFDGEDYLRQIAAEGRGGLLISAHMGNWEIAGHLLKRLDARINVVMYDGEHEQIKAYLEQVAGKRNMHVIIIKDDLSHIYQINEALKNNEMVCIHADRFIEGNKTIDASFLGKTAPFPAGPFILAATFKVPVSFVFAFKEGYKHYHFFASKPIVYPKMIKTELIQRYLADFIVQMEEKIRLYPEQWFNYYDFWKAR